MRFEFYLRKIMLRIADEVEATTSGRHDFCSGGFDSRVMSCSVKRAGQRIYAADQGCSLEPSLVNYIVPAYSSVQHIHLAPAHTPWLLPIFHAYTVTHELFTL